MAATTTAATPSAATLTAYGNFIGSYVVAVSMGADYEAEAFPASVVRFCELFEHMCGNDDWLGGGGGGDVQRLSAGVLKDFAAHVTEITLSLGVTSKGNLTKAVARAVETFA